MSATTKITVKSPRPNHSMASTAMMTAGMVMPTQRSGSRKERTRGVETGQHAEHPARGGADGQADDQALERDEQLDPERASPASRPRALAVSAGEAMMTGSTQRDQELPRPPGGRPRPGPRRAAWARRARRARGAARGRRGAQRALRPGAAGPGASGPAAPAAHRVVVAMGVVEAIVRQLAADDLGRELHQCCDRRPPGCGRASAAGVYFQVMLLSEAVMTAALRPNCGQLGLDQLARPPRGWRASTPPPPRTPARRRR